MIKIMFIKCFRVGWKTGEIVFCKIKNKDMIYFGEIIYIWQFLTLFSIISLIIELDLKIVDIFNISLNQ
jgi:hypothetical protein